MNELSVSFYVVVARSCRSSGIVTVVGEETGLKIVDFWEGLTVSKRCNGTLSRCVPPLHQMSVDVAGYARIKSLIKFLNDLIWSFDF